MAANFDRDRFHEAIYSIFVDVYHVQLQRTRDIESRATCVLGYVGIIFGFMATIGISCISDIVKNSDLKVIYTSSIISLVITFFLAACSIYYKTGELWILDNNYFMEEYVTKSKELNIIYPKLTVSFNDGINDIGNLNIQKNSFLQLSIVVFIISILLVSAFGVYYYDYVHESTSQTSGSSNVNNSTVNDTIKTQNLNDNLTLPTINNTNRLNILNSTFNEATFLYKNHTYIKH